MVNNAPKKTYFALTSDGMFVTTHPLTYKELSIKEGFEFDGVTVKAPFTIMFSGEDLRKGVRASCFHDYLCRDKKHYRRSYATDVLVNIWAEDGLPRYKCLIVKFCVNLYQKYRKGWE